MSEDEKKKDSFIQEQIRKKPFYRRKSFRRTVRGVAVTVIFGVSAGSFSAANTRIRSASRRLNATTVPRTKKAVGSPEGLLYKQRISVPSISPISRSLRRMLPLDKSLCTVAVIPCRTWDRAISFVVIFSILLFIRRVRNDIVPYPYTMPTPPRRCSASEASKK